MASLVCAEEIAYNGIKQWILDGSLRPGERLVHRYLAKELGVSPVPVILALRMLERDQLVVNTPGLGACVRTWTRQEVTDLFHIRASQEALATRLCAERATPADIAHIVTAAEIFKQSRLAGEYEANIQADVDFHLSVVRGAHCSALERIIGQLSIMQCSMRAFYLSLGMERPSFVPGVERVHDEIVDSIKSGNASAAELAGRRHVEEVTLSLESMFEEIMRSIPEDRGHVTTMPMVSRSE